MKIEAELSDPIKIRSEEGAYATTDSLFLRDAVDGSLHPIHSESSIVIVSVEEWKALREWGR